MQTMDEPRTSHPRSGIAMVLSLVAIIVVGGIVAAISGSTMIETRTAEVGRRQNQAFAVADAAAGELIGNWESGVNNIMPVGTSRNVSGTAPGGTGTYTATISRTNQEIFLVDVVGRDAASQARQRLGLLVKLRVLTFDATAALTTRGVGRVGGSASISGADNIPTGWAAECPPAGPQASGVRHPNTSQLTFFGGCNNQSCVVGDPRVLNDPTVNDETFFNYGEADWAQLSSAANIVLSGGNISQIQPRLSGTQCDRSHGQNWGEPQRGSGAVTACTNYFPTVFINGDAAIQVDRGQGILMVNGDLRFTGNFKFNGIVIVRGKLEAAGTPVITGAILAANVDLDNASGLGNIDLRFSRCAVQAAQVSGALGAGFRSRGWTQIF
jgi:hypothetical protein